MADITRLSRLVAGVQRQVDLQSNALVVGSLKVGSTPTELTEAILINLIALQNGTDFSDGTNSHTHDGRYYTETEIGSTTNGEGASLVGIEDASAYYTGTDAEAAFNELEAQIGGLTSSTYTFGEANVLTNDDAIYAALNKLDLKWGDLASTANGEGAALVGIEDSAALYTGTTVEAALAEVGQDAADLRTLSGTADGATDLGTFTGTVIPDSSTIKTGLQSLETYAEATRALVNGLEWQDSALDYITDNTVAPPTEVSGDRYILSHDGGAPNAAWDGASAGDIVEFNGTSWVATTPTTGMFISADDETTLLYYWGGASWSTKAFESTTASTGLTKVGFDIQLADAATNASGIQVSSGAITLENLSAFSTTDLSEGTNLYFTEARVLASVLTGYTAGSGGETVAATDTVLEAFQKLGGNFANLDASEVAYTPAVLADWDSSTDPGQTDDALDQLAARTTVLEGGASAITESVVAGETLTAGNRVVRLGVTDLDTPETAGRVYLADPTELSLVKTGGNKDPFHAHGLLVATGETAGASVTVTKLGPITMTGHGLAVGEPVFLDSAGALTSTAPTTASEAVVKVGMAKDANTIEVQIQIMGVN